MAPAALAHPGRLDEDGCHHVRKAFIYQSGKVVRPGEYHCHRAAIGKPFKLDGTEVLLERKDQIERDEPDDKDEAQ